MVNVGAVKAAIEARLRTLAEEQDRGEDATAVVTLDQQSIGRLSRQDALLSQAMAKATQARREAEAARLARAMRRLESDPDFGYCVDCGEEIAGKRLLFDPTVTLCISCARG